MFKARSSINKPSLAKVGLGYLLDSVSCTRLRLVGWGGAGALAHSEAPASASVRETRASRAANFCN
jgi:hypothetical protein